MRFKFTRASRKHKIGRAHVRAAMGNAVLVAIVPSDAFGWMGMFHGIDDRGIRLEIGVIGADENANLWIVMHVMPLNLK